MANWHTYQVLTKRSDRLRDLLTDRLAFAAAARTSGGASASRTASTACRGSMHLRARSRWCAVPLDRAAARRPGTTRPVRDRLGDRRRRKRPGRPADGRRLGRIASATNATRPSVPFFFKQWGGVQKKRAGRMLGHQTYDEFPEAAFAQAPVPGRAERKKLADALGPENEAWPKALVQVGRRRSGAA